MKHPVAMDPLISLCVAQSELLPFVCCPAAAQARSRTPHRCCARSKEEHSHPCLAIPNLCPMTSGHPLSLLKRFRLCPVHGHSYLTIPIPSLPFLIPYWLFRSKLIELHIIFKNIGVPLSTLAYSNILFHLPFSS